MRTTGKRDRDDRWSCLHAALRTAGLIAAVLASAKGNLLQAQQSPARSSAQVRRWLPDERQLPRQAERATHRGFEVSTGQINVVATTSRRDARLAAEQALAGWNQTAQLADHWTSVHRQANFAQGAVQVVVDSEPVRQQDQPLATLSVVGRATQISINIAAGRPSLTEQQGHLRQAAAMAFLHTAELDRQLPEWVCQGLAAYVGKRSAEEESKGEAPRAERPAPSLGGNQWRYQRIAPDRLAEPAEVKNDAAQLVQFLIEGNDARHAGEFFDCLREELATARPDQDRDFQRKNDPNLPAAGNSGRLDQLVTGLAAEYEQWKEDPQIGQPELIAGEKIDDEVQQGQQAMLFALKLAERFALAESAAIRTRITTFENGRGSAVLTGTSATRPPSLPTLLERITGDNRRSWATVGPDGELIWNTEEDKLRDLLGVADNRYLHVWENDRWVLETRLADGRQLHGWLEPNPKNAQRPLAKFSVKTPASAEPRHQPVGQRRAQPIEPHQQFSRGR